MKNGNNKDEWIAGSDNIYRDFDHPTPELALLKSTTALRIHKAIQDRGLTQKDAADILGIAPTRVSNIVCGRLKSYTLDRLLSYLVLLDIEVDFRFKDKSRAKARGNQATKV